MDRYTEVKLRIKEAIDVVALIESYLPLKPRGRILQALCPFHAEKSASFTVYPDTQSFYCFGCHKGGDVFTFVQEREGVTFREAMEMLADRAQISLEGVFSRGESGPRGPDPHQVLGEVRTFFQQQLFAEGGAAARAYLASRSLDPAIEAWGIGYAPDQPGALLRFAQQRRLPLGILEQAGLVKGRIEPLSGRVIFPIEDERGRTCGFGGRVLPGARPRADGTEPPKYINSPESPFFNKRRLLYGLYQAKQKGSRRIVVMEGYTDVIACHLAGFHGAVAALGTAFTEEHSKKLERYAQDGVVLLFDGDRAGQQAAVRAMRELVNSQVTVKIALMAEAKDPADYVVPRVGEDEELVVERRARFADLLDGADDALQTWFRLLRRRLDFAQPADLERAARECAQLLLLTDSDLRRRALLQEMARNLAVPADEFARLLKKLQPQRPPAAAKAPQRLEAGEVPPNDLVLQELDAAGQPVEAAPPVHKPLLDAERDLLAVLVEQPVLVTKLPATAFASRETERLVALVREAVAQSRTTRADVGKHVFSAIAEDAVLRSVFGKAVARAGEIKDPEAFFARLVRDRQVVAARTEARSLRQQLQAALAAGDRETADRLTQEMVAQMREHRPRAAPS